MIFQLVVGLVLIGASQQSRSIIEIKSWFIEQTMECNKQQPISADELSMMKNHKIPDSENAKCLMACVMRKTNFINDKGNYDLENTNAWSEKEFQGDNKQLEISKNINDACKKVNDEPVTDGEKGCQRAYHLCKCFIETAPKMGFALQ